MQHDEFLHKVAERAGLSSTDEARAVVDATLQTLAERILGTEAAHLAANLPVELAGALGTGDEAERFDLDEFVDRVRRRAGMDDGANVLQAAQAVMGVTREAVGEGEFGDVVSQLPNDYEPLLSMAGGMPGRHP